MRLPLGHLGVDGAVRPRRLGHERLEAFARVANHRLPRGLQVEQQVFGAHVHAGISTACSSVSCASDSCARSNA